MFVYKTPHHRDYKIDRLESMVNVGLATSAAPSFFRPLAHQGYTLVDGGVWANNPVMLAVIEALICFDIEPTQIDVLTLSCGEDPYIVDGLKLFGGKLAWADSIFAAMRLQSLSATNQARLLLGPPSVVRLVPPQHKPALELDDWARARDVLPAEAVAAVDRESDQIKSLFFGEFAIPYMPIAIE